MAKLNTADLQLLKAHAQNTLDAMPKAIEANDKMRLVLEVERLDALNDELLTLLTSAVVAHGPFGDDSRPHWWHDANALIAKARGDQS